MWCMHNTKHRECAAIQHVPACSCLIWQLQVFLFCNIFIAVYDDAGGGTEGVYQHSAQFVRRPPPTMAALVVGVEEACDKVTY